MGMIGDIHMGFRGQPLPVSTHGGGHSGTCVVAVNLGLRLARLRGTFPSCFPDSLRGISAPEPSCLQHVGKPRNIVQGRFHSYWTSFAPEGC